MDRRRLLGISLGALAGIAYGTGPLFGKLVFQNSSIDWLALLTWRFLIAMIVSWAWLLARPSARAQLRLLTRGRVAVLLFIGAFFCLNSSAYFGAIQRIPASLAALLIYLYPALVAVLSLRLGYPLHGRRAWGSLALVGIGGLFTIGGIEATTDSFGIGLALLSPIFYALYIVLAARLAGERPGETADMRSEGQGAEVSPAVAGAIMMTGTWLTFFAMAIAAREPLMPSQVPASAWPPLLGIGLISAAVAIQAFYASAALIGAAQASLVATIEPVSAVFFAIVFLGEALSPLQLLGGAIVLSGVAVAQLATPRQVRAVVLEEP